MLGANQMVKANTYKTLDIKKQFSDEVVVPQDNMSISTVLHHNGGQAHQYLLLHQTEVHKSLGKAPSVMYFQYRQPDTVSFGGTANAH
jgi:hypothetical protein